MKPRQRFSMMVIAGLFLLGPARGAGASDQAWLNNAVTFTIDSKWSLKLTQEIRTLNMTYADPYLHNVQGGLVYRLPKNFYISFLYKREHVDVQSVIYDENRYTFEGGWKTSLVKNLSFDVRGRAEIRRHSLADRDHTRFRLRFRLIYDAKIGGLRIKPFVSTESFGKTKVYTAQANRLYLGTYFPLSPNVEIVVNYIWLTARDIEDFHILNSGVELKF